MNVEDWLREATRKLEAAGISTARLDALVLLEDVLGLDRAKLLAEPKHEIDSSQATILKKLLDQRAKHQPLAYVRGKTEFYGREFLITPAVLEPRPESETMIDELKRLANLGTQPLIADVGTGSGALGITAGLELPDSHVELIDIDPNALKVAKTNVDKFTLDCKTRIGDLLSDNQEGYNVLLCNLPYVPDGYQINMAASHEPEIAIFGGKDGLDLYRELFRQIKVRTNKPLYILSESLPPQHEALEAIATESGYELLRKNDFIQVFERTK